MDRTPRRQPPRPERLRRRQGLSRPSRLAPDRGGTAGRPSAPPRTTSRSIGLYPLFSLLAALSILTFNAWLLTGPAGERIQRRAVATLTEIDRYVASQFGSIRSTAEGSQEPALALPEYPIPVTVATDEARSADQAALREMILDRAAEKVYRDGLDAYSPEGGGARLVSPAGALRLTLGNVTRDRSLAFLLAAAGFTLLATAAGARLVRPLRGPERLAALGLGAAVGAGLALGVSVLAWLLCAGAGGGDTATAEMLDIGRDAALLSARNAAVMAVLALAAFAASRVIGRQAAAAGAEH